jgi:hypothetical protein
MIGMHLIGACYAGAMSRSYWTVVQHPALSDQRLSDPARTLKRAQHDQPPHSAEDHGDRNRTDRAYGCERPPIDDIAQITRRTSQNLDASLCSKKIFSDCEGNRCPRSSTQIDRPNRESCAGIGRSHSFESVLARPVLCSRADRSAQFRSRANMQESPVPQG